MSEEEHENLVAENEALREQNAAQSVEIERLTRMVAELTRRLDKGSMNSSLPPSADSPKHQAEATKTRADRRAEAKAKRKDEVERNRGKQSGAPGQNLSMRSDPDEIIDHEPTSCVSCGDDLAGAPSESIERRQVFDTPDPIIVVTEHRSVRKRCSCGKLNVGSFPKEATAPTSYGPNVRAAGLYLLHGQHLSVERCAEAMSAMLGANVSTGFVASLAKEAAGGLDGFVAEIRRRLRRASLVHVDETSDQVRTDKWWFHVVSNELYTYLFASPTRGKAAPDDAGVLSAFGGVMVHDRLAMYFKYDQATHAVCGSHLLRDLAGVGIGWDQGWANDMAALLTEMNRAAHDARGKGRDRLPRRVLAGFLSRYDVITAAGLAANPKPVGRERDSIERHGYNLVAALSKLRAEATRFATDLDVPFSNNEAERALRMAKLHKKVSGCFQSDDGARSFATIRSYLATARKHNVGALDVLAQLFRGDAWMPPVTT
ncbi:MAG: IS66 family transposase [Acidimicrobiales bacterium]